MRIDPKELEQLETQGIEIKYDRAGNPVAYKGPWLPHYYDNHTECLRENQTAHRIEEHKKLGLNEHAQTPEQEESQNRRRRVTEEKKKKAEMAAEMAVQNK